MGAICFVSEIKKGVSVWSKRIRLKKKRSVIDPVFEMEDLIFSYS